MRQTSKHIFLSIILHHAEFHPILMLLLGKLQNRFRAQKNNTKQQNTFASNND
jgi:hypothetical protein